MILRLYTDLDASLTDDSKAVDLPVAADVHAPVVVRIVASEVRVAVLFSERTKQERNCFVSFTSEWSESESEAPAATVVTDSKRGEEPTRKRKLNTKGRSIVKSTRLMFCISF